MMAHVSTATKGNGWQLTMNMTASKKEDQTWAPAIKIT
jgi:hypothetical protein